MEGTYLKQLPKDVTNIIDQYQKEHIKKILTEVLNPKGETYYDRSMISSGWSGVYPLYDLEKRWREFGINGEFRHRGNKWYFDIIDVPLLSDEELFDVLLESMKSVGTIPRINIILENNNANFRLVTYGEKVPPEIKLNYVR